MELADLKKQYDIMQMEFGAPGLRSVYYGGCDVDPDICFVFMNPTGKNVAAEPSWTGIRSPWIGTKHIWDVFLDAGICRSGVSGCGGARDLYNESCEMHAGGCKADCK